LKVLVTGSEGSLMQRVIPHLLAQGHEVRGIDNFFRHGQIERARDYEFVEGDLCAPAVVSRGMEGVEVVFQGAARIFGVRGFHEYAADILSYDVLLHAQVMAEAARRGVRKVVFLSSSMVYEKCKTVPSREEDVDTMEIPSTDYALSKLVCERMCRAYDSQYGLKFTIWRPFNIITPLEKAEEETGMAHVFADLIRKIMADKQNPVELLGDGEQVRCFTWIDDVAGAIARYSFLPESDNEAFNLGNPEPVTIKDLAARIFSKAQGLGVVSSDEELKFVHRKIYRDDVRTRIPSVEKTAQYFGFKPTLSLDQALDRCLSQAREFYAEA